MQLFIFFSPRNDPAAHLRKNDALVQLIQKIRSAHHVSQADLGACMKLGEQTIRAIEAGRQQLPGIQPGSGFTLHEWFEEWYRCLSVTTQERKDVEDLLIVKVLGRKVMHQLGRRK